MDIIMYISISRLLDFIVVSLGFACHFEVRRPQIFLHLHDAAGLFLCWALSHLKGSDFESIHKKFFRTAWFCHALWLAWSCVDLSLAKLITENSPKPIGSRSRRPALCKTALRALSELAQKGAQRGESKQVKLHINFLLWICKELLYLISQRQNIHNELILDCCVLCILLAGIHGDWISGGAEIAAACLAAMQLTKARHALSRHFSNVIKCSCLFLEPFEFRCEGERAFKIWLYLFQLSKGHCQNGGRNPRCCLSRRAYNFELGLWCFTSFFIALDFLKCVRKQAKGKQKWMHKNCDFHRLLILCIVHVMLLRPTSGWCISGWHLAGVAEHSLKRR